MFEMTVVSNSWVSAATSYRLGVRWGGMRGGRAPGSSCWGSLGEPRSPESPDTGDSVMARKGSGTLEPENPGIRAEEVVSLARGDTRKETDVSVSCC